MPLFQPFVFEKDNFVQSDTIYASDIAVFLNRTEKKMYLWAGKRASQENINEAQQAWMKILGKYADFQAINLIKSKELTDFELAKEIRLLLGQHAEEETSERARNIYNFVAKILIGVGILFSGLIPIYALNLFLTSIQNDLVIVSEANFTLFFDSASILLYISGGSFLITLIFALFGKNSRIAMPSGLAIITNIGWWAYLNQRDYLFYLQNYGSMPGVFQILGRDFLIFIGIITFLFISICMFYLIAMKSRLKSKKSKKTSSSIEQEPV